MDTNSNVTQSNQGQLKRSLAPWQLFVYGLIFMGPMSGLLYYPAGQADSNGFTHIGFIIAICIVVLTVSAYQQMIHEFPQAGSVYTYVSRGINGKVGFVAGWALLLDYGLIPMYLTKLTAIYLESIAPVIPWWIWVVLVSALIYVLAFTGVRVLVSIENIAGAFGFILIVIFCVGAIGYITGDGRPIFDAATFYNSEMVNWTGLMNIAALGILSFVGFDAITTLIEESKYGTKYMSGILIGAVLIVGSIFIISTYLAQATIPYNDLPAEAQPVAYAYLLKIFNGPVVGTTLIALKQSGTWAVIIAAVIASSRILYAMGRDNVLPNKFFGYLHPKYKTPTRCSNLITTIAMLGALTFKWETIADIVSFGACLGFIMVNVSVIVYFFIRKKEHKILRNLIIPLIAILALLYIVSKLPVICLVIGISWTILGFIYMMIKYKSSEDFRDAIDNCRLSM